MTVVTVLEATPNRLLGMFKYLQSAGEEGLIQERIPKLFAHNDLRHKSSEGENSTSTIPGLVFNELKRLGLASESGGRFRVPEELLAVGNDEAIALLTQSVLKQQSVVNAIAWLLMQDPCRPLDWSDNPKEAVSKELPASDGFDLTNKERLQQLAYWARFLGYASLVGLRKKKWIVPDPTPILARFLPTILGRDEIRVSEVLSQLSKQTSVLEGGSVRTNVESMAHQPRPSDELTPATSFGLRVLERQGKLRLVNRDDAADAYYLKDERRTPVSHLALGRN